MLARTDSSDLARGVPSSCHPDFLLSYPGPEELQAGGREVGDVGTWPEGEIAAERRHSSYRVESRQSATK